MAGGLVIPLSLNPREWISGIRVVERSLEGMEDDLEEVEDVGDRLERALKDNFDDIARDADRAGRDVADNFDGKAGRVGDIGGEIADEFTENFGEAIRGGDPAGLVLETFTSLGPALGGLGIGAAVVAGMVKSFVDAAAEQRARVTEASKALFLSAAEAEEQGKITQRAFVNGVISEAQAMESLIEATGAEDLHGAMQVIAEDAAAAGVEVETVALAYLGNRDAVRELRDAQAETNTELDAQAGKTKTVTGYYGQSMEYASDTTIALEDQNRALDDLISTGRTQRSQNKENYDLLVQTRAVQSAIADEAERAARAGPPGGGRRQPKG